MQPHRVRLDGDAALALQVHRVEHLFHHFALRQRAGVFEQTVGERRLAVVDMRDDREVADEGRDPCCKLKRFKQLSHMSLRTFEGNLDAHELRFAIVLSRFNSFITERLLERRARRAETLGRE